MAGASDIEWTEATWNPIAGCTILSPGCTNCYAQRLAARLQAMGSPKYQGTTRKSGRRHIWTGRLNVDRAALDAPLRWRRPLRIFVNSMSDLFQDAVPDEVIASLWSVMKAAHWHTYQILTKRPDRMLDVVSRFNNPLSNVWLGTSVENAAYLGRIDVLRAVPAHIRFVSFEPLLGPVEPVD
jgi:protein gp37